MLRLRFVLLLLALPVMAQQPAADLYLMNLDGSDASRLPTPKGYSNQPSFMPDGRLLFTGAYDGQADLYLYDGQKIHQLTFSQESEYSPTLMPDGENLSSVRVEHDGTQRLWQFPLDGGPGRVLLPDVKGVGYHVWVSQERLALFIVGEPHRLVLAHTGGGPVQELFANPGRCLASVPGKNWFSAMRHSDKETRIVLFANDMIAESWLPPFEDAQDYAWTQKGNIFMGKGSVLYMAKPNGKKTKWEKVADLGSVGIKQVSRMSVSHDNKQLALVSLL